ncbi:SGNH/GDSL hydrolase family protein [Amycolatopsis rhabdoformis]|uniref:SGNH/GDSL hydrolase family protein n=1 Tax=Amycolatopsis rhabdoformis TaxID=1448059 RepID=A0ABZ1I967_9PSEU|nr:SGNH/GDSL hydrolase family protein [Amycolatopsis rhabdoformis]WSE30468.1 SGNH/GDSL hydrolase family protein [Amycolatopsis rhabdoformis]
MRRSPLVVLLVIAGLVAGATAATASTPKFTKYVSLGDSYTAGPLIPWQQASWCFRSNNNYPSWLATRLGIYDEAGAFTDVSCSSADTSNMTQPQVTPSPSIPLSTQEPQFDALHADTDLVTIGIGGNDDSVFGDLTGTCPTLRAQDPTGAPCQERYTVNGVDTMATAVQATGRNVAQVVKGVKDRSPAATIVLVGYPRLVPPTGTCPSVIPFADGDYRWADGIEQQLNAAIAGAAASEGVKYVDTYGPSLGHDACAGAEAWVNGQSTNLFEAVAYHPFRAGMKAEAALIAKALGVPAKSLKTPAPRSTADARQLAKAAHLTGA